MVSEFKNEAVLDFTEESNRKKQLHALDLVRSQLGREYDLVIGGEHLKGPKTFTSINPGKKSEIVGVFQSASVEQALQAIEAAAAAFQSWKKVPARKRSDLLFRAAELLGERRFESNAWMILEVGKSWAEGDADSAEAIDFCEFYAREMLRLGGPQPLTPVAGEKNYLRYIPLGVGIVIPPWNFPMAIMVGMTTASLWRGTRWCLNLRDRGQPARAPPLLLPARVAGPAARRSHVPDQHGQDGLEDAARGHQGRIEAGAA